MNGLFTENTIYKWMSFMPAIALKWARRKVAEKILVKEGEKSSSFLPPPSEYGS